MSRDPDLLAACGAFVAVADRGGFSAGAAALQIPQSVASRRVAALERAVDGRVLDRSHRAVTLTAFGRAVLPAARDVVTAVDQLRERGRTLHEAPIRLALPQEIGFAELGEFGGRLAREGTVVQVTSASSARRAVLLETNAVDLTVLATTADTADWAEELGVGTRRPGPDVRLSTLRPRRGRADRHTLWILPEDDVAPIRDPLERQRDRTGLAADQVRVAADIAAAVQRCHAYGDLVLTTRADAARLGLRWRRLIDGGVQRWSALAQTRTGPGLDPQRWRELLGALLSPAPGSPRSSRTLTTPVVGTAHE